MLKLAQYLMHWLMHVRLAHLDPRTLIKKQIRKKKLYLEGSWKGFVLSPMDW